MNLVTREHDENKYEEMPMTTFLFTFIKKAQKCQEKDEFSYQDWLDYLEALKAVTHHSVTELEFPPPPDSKKGKSETFQLLDVLETMKKISKDIECTGQGQDEAAREARFLIGNLVRQLKEDVIYMLKLLAPKVYKFRTELVLVNFAAAAFLPGEPNIELYK